MSLKTRSDDLELLLAVIEFGGFSAAADALNIQVARISRSVTKIEKALNTAILIRTTRRVMLTDEGKKFIDAVTLGLKQIQYAESSLIVKGKVLQGKLRIDAVSPFIFHQLTPYINAFTKAYPEIEIELNSNEGIVDLIEKRTDVAIRIGKLEDSTLHASALGKSPLFVVASPKYIAQNGLPKTPDELKNHKLIGFSNIKSLNQWPVKGLNNVNPDMTASNGETIRQLALSGSGITCLSGFMVNSDIAEGRLISLLEPYRLMGSDRELVNAVYYKSSPVAERVKAFIDFIRPRLTL
ncbi:MULTISPECIES: LysR family transcriptional regulator [unclassified Pseudoalteromonas]|uniref:LysR family transcriptional regulator n=1 Tax=unclassified Pseudoalteromonas TaxID=194690 RepID=UPI00191C8112|nr:MULTISPECIES: LysR family transcriptional regulator [unclassified Pseudoalteromonas]MDP2635638.1 LysR family transcriptional regulator [Pseudoalteromonas sp. 1_MG-2023]